MGDEKERLLAKKPKLGRSREKKKKLLGADFRFGVVAPNAWLAKA